MSTRKQWIVIDNITLALWIVAVIIAFVFNKYYVSFYCWIAVIIINITFYLYEYKITNKNQKNQQLECLYNLRKNLSYATVLVGCMCGFAYFWMDDISLINGSLLVMIGVLLIMSILALIVCNLIIVRIRK